MNKRYTSLVRAIAQLLLSALVVPLFQASASAQISAATDGTNTTVTQSGNTFNITNGTQSGTNLFHSFHQFGLNSGQIANFLANPTIQNILSRVTGGDASVIQGQIQVTGGNANLYLMNPAGIVFGANSSLNVPGAFTATTANGIGLGSGWFNAIGPNNYVTLLGNPQQFAFTGLQPGVLINAGNLAVGPGQSITLLGGTVINTGTLTAPGGTVTIAAVPGEKLVRINQAGSLLSLDLPTETKTAINPPTVTPLSLPALLTGGNLSSATGLTVENGVTRLTGSGVTIPTEAGVVIASNQIDVAGSMGGTVHILGQKVGVVNGTVNAAGTNGGGTVLIGGDYKGQGVVPNAQRTYVSQKSAINADALQHGNGGTVVVWADDHTRFDGKISARGGAQSGNGGFVEVSGKTTLQFQGNVDTTALQGAPGTILLDPQDITIANGASSPAGVDAAVTDGIIALSDFSGDDIFISIEVLRNLGGIVSLQASRDITVSDALTFTPGTAAQTVTFNAGRNIELFDVLQTQGRSLILTAGNEVVIRSFSDGIFTNGGNITINSSLQSNALTAANIDAGSGATGGQVQLNGAITNADNLNISGSTVRIGPVQVSGNLVVNGATQMTGGEVASTSGNIEFNGPITLLGDTAIRNNFLGSLGSLTINGSINGNHNLTIAGGRGGTAINGDIGTTTPVASAAISSFLSQTQLGANITTNGGDLEIGGFLGTTVLTNNVTLNTGAFSGGNITLRDPVDSDATPRSLTLIAGTGNVNTDSTNVAIGATNPLNQLNISGNDIQIRDARTTGDIQLNAQRNVILNDNQLNAGGEIRLLAQDTVQIGDSTGAGGEFIANAGTNLIITGNQAITIQATDNPLSILQAVGNITLTSGGQITANARFQSGGTTTFNSPLPVRSDLETVIRSLGDVSFGNYEGLALKIEALGSITGGNINITGPNATLSGTDPDIATLVNSAALILRAGVPALQGGAIAPSGSLGGTSFLTSPPPSTPANVTVGTIDTAVGGVGGPVIITAPGNVTTGNINAADGAASLPENTQPITITAGGELRTGDVATRSSSVTLRAGANLVAGDIETGGLGSARNSAVILSSAGGNIQVNTIDTGAGGLDVTTPGTFRAVGARFFNGGGFQNEELVVKDNPDLIEYLVNNIPGLTRESLVNSTTRISVDRIDYPSSIIARPNNIDDPNNARIVIRHAGESIPGDRVRVEGSGSFSFVTGPAITPVGEGFEVQSGNLTDFNPALAVQSFSLNRTATYRVLNTPAAEFPANVSGTVAGIVVGAGSNSNLFNTLQNRPFVRGPETGEVNPGPRRVVDSTTTGSTTITVNNAAESASRTTQVTTRGGDACYPSTSIASAVNAPETRSPATTNPCTVATDEQQILKILGEDGQPQPRP